MAAYREATFGKVELIGRLANLGHPLYVTSLDASFPATGPARTRRRDARHRHADRVPERCPIPLGKPSQPYADEVRRLLRSDGPIVMFGDSQRADIGIAELLGADGVLINANLRVAHDLAQPHYVTTTLEADPILHEVALEVWP